MQTDLRRRDLIGDLDFSKEEVETVLDVAFDLKRKRALGELQPYLRDKVLAMLFFFSSTRTRGSFEAGMAQLGGHAAFIESKTTHRYPPEATIQPPAAEWGDAGGLAFKPTRTLLDRVLPGPGEGPGEGSRRHGFFRIEIHGGGHRAFPQPD